MASSRRNIDTGFSTSGLAPGSSSSDAVEMMGALRDIMIAQHGQIDMLRDGMLSAQRIAVVTMDRAAARRAEIVIHP